MGKEKAEGRGGFSMQNMNACLHVHRAWVAWAMPAYSVQMHAVRSSLTWPCMHHMHTAHRAHWCRCMPLTFTPTYICPHSPGHACVTCAQHAELISVDVLPADELRVLLPAHQVDGVEGEPGRGLEQAGNHGGLL